PTEASGMLMMQATAREGVSIEEIEQSIDEEIAKISAGGISEDELTRARNRAEIEHAHHIENYDERADIIGMFTTFFGDAEVVNTWLEPYEKATVDDITRAAATYLVPENRATS